MNLRAAVCVALLVSACAVDESADVARYRSVLDAGVPAQLAAPNAGDTLDAKRAMQLASASNEALAIQGEAFLRALIDRRRAAATYLPNVTLSPSYFLRDRSGGVDDGLDLPISGSIDVNAESDTANADRAGHEIVRQRALLYEAQDALLLDVARTLFEVLRAERSGSVLESSLAMQHARVDDVRARRDVGFARPLDVSLSESSAADARVSLLEARRRASTGRAALEFLTGAALSQVELDGALDVPEAIASVEQLVAQAELDRQDVAAATAGVDVAADQVRVAKGRWYPSLALDLDVFLSRTSAPTDQDWRALIEVNLPLFTGGRIQADVRDALSRLREAKLAYQFTRRAVQRDIEVAVLNVHESRERVVELRVQLAAAGDASGQAESLYGAGLATNLERLAAQNAQLSTELALENAEFDRKVFYLDLLRTTGALHSWVGFTRPPRGEIEHAKAR